MERSRLAHGVGTYPAPAAKSRGRGSLRSPDVILAGRAGELLLRHGTHTGPPHDVLNPDRSR